MEVEGASQGAGPLSWTGVRDPAREEEGSTLQRRGLLNGRGLGDGVGTDSGGPRPGCELGFRLAVLRPLLLELTPSTFLTCPHGPALPCLKGPNSLPTFLAPNPT